MGKIFQFEFLVMTEKNIFAYKLFFAVKILIHFYVKFATAPPPEKCYTLFPSNPSLKFEVLSSTLFSKFHWRFNPLSLPSRNGGRGVHTMKMQQLDIFSCLKSFLIAGALPFSVSFFRRMITPFLQLWKA